MPKNLRQEDSKQKNYFLLKTIYKSCGYLSSSPWTTVWEVRPIGKWIDRGEIFGLNERGGTVNIYINLDEASTWKMILSTQDESYPLWLVLEEYVKQLTIIFREVD